MVVHFLSQIIQLGIVSMMPALDFAEYPIMKAIFIALTGLLLTIGAAQAQTATPTSASVDPRWGCDTDAAKQFATPDLGEPQNIDNFKKQARRLENRGYTIIASIGDQKSDLAGRHAEMTFKISNPFYFIPEK